MIKGIIFDLDGTLLNTINDLNNSVNKTYELLNVNKSNTVSLTMSMVGHGIRNLIEQCFNKTDVDLNIAYDTFLKVYKQEYLKTSIPYKGIKELIEELNKLNIKIGVNSNKNDEYTKNLIKTNFNNINLNYVIGKRENIKVKPDPMGVKLIIKEMGLNKEEVLYCGDSDTDVYTAKNAGIKCISVSWGFRSKDVLKKVNDCIIDKPSELIERINNEY